MLPASLFASTYFVQELHSLTRVILLGVSNAAMNATGSIRRGRSIGNGEPAAHARLLLIGRDNWGRMRAQGHPRLSLRALALDELITRVTPGQNRTALIIENEVTPVRAHHQHGMTRPHRVQNNRHP